MTKVSFDSVLDITDRVLAAILVESFENDEEIEQTLRLATDGLDRLFLAALGWALTRWPPPITGPIHVAVQQMTRATLEETLFRRIDYDEERRKHIAQLLEYNNRTLERARAAEAKLRSYGLG